MTAYVFTLRSLKSALARLPDISMFTTKAPAYVDDVAAIHAGSLHFRIHREDSERARRVIFFDDESELNLERLRARAAQAALERAYLFSERATELPIRLPYAWGQFKDRSFISFFACPLGKDARALRWIAEVQRPSIDVCFWQMTSHDQEIKLVEFDAPENEYFSVVSVWTSALAAAKDVLVGIDGGEGPANPTEFDLEVPALVGATGDLSYSSWSRRLTEEQKSFVEQPPDRSVKLRGPAGSGKTLALEMKALREAYRARDSGTELRILFATHSWAMAAQVDADLRQLDEGGAAGSIDVYPLITMAQEVLPGNRWDTELQLVGEDSFSGKQQQLARINELWESFVSGDWLTYRDDVSEGFRQRVESSEPGNRQSLVWDCLIEFGCVLGADGIFPGINAEPRYLGLPRASWMMPLTTDADKRAMLYVYERHMKSLLDEHLFTTDQV
ncbi:MAG: hypothetical protein M3P18_06425, partial [Actinomycetota bacterium]|nr:hypothetical protein [Actinomycetota bacterium]